jgi:hypothetical protein
MAFDSAIEGVDMVFQNQGVAGKSSVVHLGAVELDLKGFFPFNGL